MQDSIYLADAIIKSKFLDDLETNVLAFEDMFKRGVASASRTNGSLQVLFMPEGSIRTHIEQFVLCAISPQL